MKVNLIKQGQTLIPASESDLDKLASIKVGRVVEADIKQKRNYKFHKKFFAMLNLGFESFEPERKEYKGVVAEKNFDRFRKDVIIMAGFYDATYDIQGNLKLDAHSISFGKMSEDEFNNVYNACCNVLLKQVLHNYTREDLDHVVEQLTRF